MYHLMDRWKSNENRRSAVMRDKCVFYDVFLVEWSGAWVKVDCLPVVCLSVGIR